MNELDFQGYCVPTEFMDEIIKGAREMKREQEQEDEREEE